MELITPIIAQATTNNSDIITWGIILTLTTIAGNVATVIALLVNRKQKREVSFGFVPASKEEFDDHRMNNKEEHDQLFSKLGGVERGLRGEFSNEIKTVRSEMTETVRQLAALNNNAELLNQAMAAERARLDREIERRRS